MNKNTVWSIVIILVLVVAGIVWYRSSPSEDMGPAYTANIPADTSSAPAPTASTSATVTTPPASTGSVKEFTVIGSNFAFAPSTLTVKKGDTVKINFQNGGGMHDFVIDEFNVRTNVIGSDQSQAVQFVADKAGTFQYYCSVGSHRSMGMWGTLTVTN